MKVTALLCLLASVSAIEPDIDELMMMDLLGELEEGNDEIEEILDTGLVEEIDETAAVSAVSCSYNHPWCRQTESHCDWCTNTRRRRRRRRRRTPYPTRYPTGFPTPHPTRYPTTQPTAYPTPPLADTKDSLSHSGDYECDSSVGGVSMTRSCANFPTTCSHPFIHNRWNRNPDVRYGGYSNLKLTDPCNNGVCNRNPIYGGTGGDGNGDCNKDQAIAYCKTQCDGLGDACQGFSFERASVHGAESCKFYAQSVDMSQPRSTLICSSWHYEGTLKCLLPHWPGGRFARGRGHSGSVCMKSALSQSDFQTVSTNGDWQKVGRNNLVHRVHVDGTYRVDFDIKPYGTSRQLTNLFHIGNTDAERLPAMWFIPGTTRLHIRSGSEVQGWNHGCDIRHELPQGVVTHVRMEVTFTSVTITYSGATQQRTVCPITGHKTGNNIPVYLSDPWYPAAIADIRNFRYLTAATPGTSFPTSFPTPFPTPRTSSPTPSPTNTPTTSPTLHPCDDNITPCDQRNRDPTDLKASCQQELAEILNFNQHRGTSTGCDRARGILMEYEGAPCVWTSHPVAIEHPHSFENVFVQALAMDHGDQEADDQMKVEIRACGEENHIFHGRMISCSPWADAIKKDGEITQGDGWGQGWTWVAQTEGRAAITADHNSVQIRVTMINDGAHVFLTETSGGDSYFRFEHEAHALTTLKIYGGHAQDANGDCTDATQQIDRGICHKQGDSFTCGCVDPSAGTHFPAVDHQMSYILQSDNLCEISAGEVEMMVEIPLAADQINEDGDLTPAAETALTASLASVYGVDPSMITVELVQLPATGAPPSRRLFGTTYEIRVTIKAADIDQVSAIKAVAEDSTFSTQLVAELQTQPAFETISNEDIVVGEITTQVDDPSATSFPTKTPTNSPTPSPTAEPTTYPTKAPTIHPCNDGSHGCDKSTGGICYPTTGNGWTCACANTHWCSAGCSQPHTGHTCIKVTATPTTYPTPYPTSKPTTYPTPSPTTYPTPSPTTYPTPYPTPYPTSNPTPSPTPAPTANCPVTCALEADSLDRRSHTHDKNWNHALTGQQGNRVKVTHNVYDINTMDTYKQHRCYRVDDKCLCECIDSVSNVDGLGFFEDGAQHGSAPRNNAAYYMPNQDIHRGIPATQSEHNMNPTDVFNPQLETPASEDDEMDMVNFWTQNAVRQP